MEGKEVKYKLIAGLAMLTGFIVIVASLALNPIPSADIYSPCPSQTTTTNPSASVNSSPAQTSSVAPSVVPTNTATPTLNPTIAPTNTATPTPRPVPTATLTATPTPTPNPSSSSSSSPGVGFYWGINQVKAACTTTPPATTLTASPSLTATPTPTKSSTTSSLLTSSPNASPTSTAEVKPPQVANLIEEKPASLVGKITEKVADAHNPIAGVKISKSVISTSDPDLWAAYTDKDGIYRKDGLKSGEVINIKAEKDRYQTYYSKTLTLIPGDNILDIKLIKDDSSWFNILTGRVVDQNKKPVAKAMVALMQNNTVKIVALTDQDGDYTMDVYYSGTFDVKVMSNFSFTSPQFLETVPPNTTVNFPNPSGTVEQRNFELGQPLNRLYSVTIRAWDESEAKPIELNDATVTLSTGDKGVFLQQGKSPALFKDLTSGSYSLEVKREGYITELKQFVLMQPQQVIDVVLVKKGDGCIRAPQQNVSEFYFCGIEAVKMQKDSKYAGRWQAIDSTIGNLRQSHGPNLPAKVVIKDDRISNAYYYPSFGSCSSDEKILFTTSLISSIDDKDTAHTTIHEFGHGRDWHKGGCRNYWSSEENFLNFRHKLSQSDLSAYIKDSIYDAADPSFGHPNSNVTETYASAFHIGAAHYSDFSLRIASLKADIQSALEGLVALSLKD
jgi:hypothetical protein